VLIATGEPLIMATVLLVYVLYVVAVLAFVAVLGRLPY
jgi:hypothetical protein